MHRETQLGQEEAEFMVLILRKDPQALFTYPPGKPLIPALGTMKDWQVTGGMPPVPFRMSMPWFC